MTPAFDRALPAEKVVRLDGHRPEKARPSGDANGTMAVLAFGRNAFSAFAGHRRCTDRLTDWELSGAPLRCRAKRPHGCCTRPLERLVRRPLGRAKATHHTMGPRLGAVARVEHEQTLASATGAANQPSEATRRRGAWRGLELGTAHTTLRMGFGSPATALRRCTEQRRLRATIALGLWPKRIFSVCRPLSKPGPPNGPELSGAPLLARPLERIVRRRTHISASRLRVCQALRRRVDAGTLE